VREGVTGSPASSSNESSARIRIDPSYPPKLAQQRPRIDGFSKPVVAGPVTTADVTQGKDCRLRLQDVVVGELRVPLQ